MSIERNRSMTPVVMSWLTLTAVMEAPKPAHSNRTPGTTYVTYAVPVWIAPPKR
jgi:hypothetical protein